jgi:segregation and condensation protein A
MTDNNFSIKVGEFEGPLDLLLQLIEKKKLHISQVSVAQVADDYINHIAELNQLPKHEVADFLVIASTLMLIKSTALLPTLSLTAEETASADELEYRLKLYQYIQSICGGIKNRFGAAPAYFREGGRVTEPIFSPTSEITTSSLSNSIRQILSSLPKPEILPQLIVKKVRSLQEAINDLASRIQSAISMRFSEFAPQDKNEKISVIVSFLGMLELVKQGIIEVEQSGHFQDIGMQTTTPSLPRY